MGGRGGASGLSGGGLSEKELSNRLPDAKDFSIEMPPPLEGSEKQVAWANDIRKKILKELGIYTITRTSDGRQSDLYKTATQGKEAIIKDIKSNILINSASGKLREEKIENAVSGYKDLASRIRRLNSISQNSSARFWIDNRTNQLENDHNKKFRNIIDGK